MQTNEFLNNVCEKIKYKPIRNEISEELKNHIEEQKETFIQSGIEENVAEQKAIENMGSAEELGKKLNKIHKPKLDWKLVLLILILIAFGALVNIIRIKSYLSVNELDIINGYSQAKKYIFALIIGIVLSLLIYFIDYRKLSKYSMIFYILATLSMVMTYILGTRLIYNTRPYLRLGGITVLPTVLAIPLYIIAFIGFIHNKSNITITINNEKNINMNGTIVIIVFSIISLCLCLMMEFVVDAVIMALVYMIIATIKLSSLKKKGIKYIVMLWGIPLFLVLLVVLIMVNNPYQYRLNRIKVSFNPQADPYGSGWQAMERNKVIESAKMFGKTEETEASIISLFEVESNWAIISILANYGWGVALGMLLAIILLSVKLIVNAINIKEEYGKWLTIGISTMFILQSLFNVAMNLGFGIIANFNLPLVSYGLISLIMNMMSLALVLSVYRRKDINTYETKYEKVV